MSQADKPSVEGLLKAVRFYGATRIDADRSRTAKNFAVQDDAFLRVEEYAERLASQSAARSFSDFIRNATPQEKEALYSDVMGRAAARQQDTIEAASIDEDRKLMEMARHALTRLVARIEANGGIGEYATGPAFVMQGACDAIAALRSRLDRAET